MRYNLMLFLILESLTLKLSLHILKMFLKLIWVIFTIRTLK